MNQLAWPFLVSRNLYLDYRTIVAPDFMSQTKISNLLARATDGDLTPPNTAILRKIIGSQFGDFIVIFQIVKATKFHIKQGDIEELLKDPFGREIYLIEGLVIKDTLNNNQFNLDVFDKINQTIREGYCKFWSQIEPCPAIPSQPFKVQQFDVNKPIFTLQNADLFIIKNKFPNEYGFLRKYELNNPKKNITSVAFGKDALYSRYEDQNVFKFDLSQHNNQAIELITGNSDNKLKSSIIISPDNKWIAIGCYLEAKNYVLLKNLTNKEERKLDEQNWKDFLTQNIEEDWKDRIILSLAFSSDSKFLAAGTKNGRILRWSMNDYKRKVIADNLEGEVTTLVFSNEENILISGDSKGNIHKWQDDLTFVDPFVANLSQINSIAISSDNKYLAAGCEDSLRIWDFAKEQTFLNLDEYKQINTVAFSPDNNLIAFGTAKGKVIVWDLKQSHKIWQYDHEKSVNSVIFNPQNRNLVSGSEDGIIQIWEY